jgi:hypothetical protein
LLTLASACGSGPDASGAADDCPGQQQAVLAPVLRRQGVSTLRHAIDVTLASLPELEGQLPDCTQPHR